MDWTIPVLAGGAALVAWLSGKKEPAPPTPVAPTPKTSAEIIAQKSPEEVRAAVQAVVQEAAPKEPLPGYVKLDYPSGTELSSAEAKARGEALAEYERSLASLRAKYRAMPMVFGAELKARNAIYIEELRPLEAKRDAAFAAASKATQKAWEVLLEQFERTKNEWRAKGYEIVKGQPLGTSIILPHAGTGTFQGPTIWYARLPGVTLPRAGAITAHH